LFSCSFLSMTCHGIEIFVSIGVYRGLCIGILDVSECFFAIHGECIVCRNACLGIVLLVSCLYVFYAVMCIVLLLSAGMV
jgi:hypothetical protein